MTYEVVMPYHLHMPSYFLGTFTEYPLLYSPLIPGPKAVQEADTRSAPDGLMELPIRTAK